jgi:RNA polymerase sigma-B factor
VGGGSRPGPDRSTLEQVEELLAEVQDCADPAVRSSAEERAVVLAIELADGIARRYSGRGIDLDDLRQVARMGLVKAVRGYSPDRGNGFAAYAVPTITGEVKRHFRDCGWAVRPPRRLQEMRADLAAEEDRLRQELGREPSTEELAAALRVRPGDVAEALECYAAYRSVSLDAPAPTGASVMDSLPSRHDDFGALETRAALGQAIAGLTEREQRILRLRFVEDLTQREIGEALGVSQMQISRLLTGILRRLHSSLSVTEQAA